MTSFKRRLAEVERRVATLCAPTPRLRIPPLVVGQRWSPEFDHLPAGQRVVKDYLEPTPFCIQWVYRITQDPDDHGRYESVEEGLLPELLPKWHSPNAMPVRVPGMNKLILETGLDEPQKPVRP